MASRGVAWLRQPAGYTAAGATSHLQVRPDSSFNQIRGVPYPYPVCIRSWDRPQTDNDARRGLVQNQLALPARQEALVPELEGVRSCQQLTEQNREIAR